MYDLLGGLVPTRGPLAVSRNEGSRWNSHLATGTGGILATYEMGGPAQIRICMNPGPILLIPWPRCHYNTDYWGSTFCKKVDGFRCPGCPGSAS